MTWWVRMGITVGWRRGRRGRRDIAARQGRGNITSWDGSCFRVNIIIISQFSDIIRDFPRLTLHDKAL